jgi:hypothetical protein
MNKKLISDAMSNLQAHAWKKRKSTMTTEQISEMMRERALKMHKRLGHNIIDKVK